MMQGRSDLRLEANAIKVNKLYTHATTDISRNECKSNPHQDLCRG